MAAKSVVLRVERERRYATVNLDPMDQDESLSWRAAGLLYYLLTRPDGWSFYVGDLLNRKSDGRRAVQTALKELEDLGYLDRHPVRGEGGEFDGWSWVVRENPSDGEPTGRESDRTRTRPDREQICIAGTRGSSNQGSRVGTPYGRNQPASKDNGVDESDTLWAWSIWLEYLGGSGPQPSLGTGKRAQALRLYLKDLREGRSPHTAEVLFRATLRAILSSSFHMSKRAYQWPESTFRPGDPERRERWMRDAESERYLAGARHDIEVGGYDPDWVFVSEEDQARRDRYAHLVDAG